MFRPAQCEIWMIIRVVPNLVPFSNNPPHKPRITLRVHSHEKKGCLYICSSQNVQNLWCPLRIGAIVEGDGNLMLAACALMIKGWELCKLHILRGKVTFWIDREISHSIRAAFVNGDNLAVAHVGDRIRSFQDFERLACLFVDLEIARYT